MKTKQKRMGCLLLALLIMTSAMPVQALTLYRNCTPEVVVLTDNQMSQIAGGDLFGAIGDVIEDVCVTVADTGRWLWKQTVSIIDAVLKHLVFEIEINPETGEVKAVLKARVQVKSIESEPNSTPEFGKDESNGSSTCPSHATNPHTVDQYDEP